MENVVRSGPSSHTHHMYMDTDGDVLESFQSLVLSEPYFLLSLSSSCILNKDEQDHVCGREQKRERQEMFIHNMNVIYGIN